MESIKFFKKIGAGNKAESCMEKGSFPFDHDEWWRGSEHLGFMKPRASGYGCADSELHKGSQVKG